MYQKLYNWKQIRRIATVSIGALLLAACHSCVVPPDPDNQFGNRLGDQYGDRIDPSGLVVGAVISSAGGPQLKPFERWRYADQLASTILHNNPELSGHIDSYEYLVKRVGEPLNSLLQGYRLEGDLSDRALETLKRKQLRRRYLMLVTLLPNEQSLPLKPDMQPVIGPINREVQDYYDLNRQTVLLTSVRVQVYDTVSARKISDITVRSDEGGRMLATESKSRKYVGNSLLASISNSVSNVINGGAGDGYPAAPRKDDVLAFIWGHVAEKLPAELF